jgi:NADH-quinone oxidoreductase subunit K
MKGNADMIESLMLSVVLFAIGAFGAMARRNILIVMLSVEVMMNGALLAFVTLAHEHYQSGRGGGAGQVFALVIIALAAAEIAVGLSLVLVFFRSRGSVDTRDMATMKE